MDQGRFKGRVGHGGMHIGFRHGERMREKGREGSIVPGCGGRRRRMCYQEAAARDFRGGGGGMGYNDNDFGVTTVVPAAGVANSLRTRTLA